MSAPRILPTVLAASGLAVLGAVLASLGVHLLVMSGVDYSTRSALLQAPVAFPHLRARGGAPVLAFFLGLLLVAAVVALVTWLGARSASRERGATAVALSVWLGTVLGGWLSGAVSGASFLVPLNRRLPPDVLLSQLTVLSSGGAVWGVTGGWLVAVVAGVVFALTNRSRPGTGPVRRVPGPLGSGSG